MKILSLALLLAVSAVPQQPQEITAEDRAQMWRARSEAEAAQRKLTAVIASLQIKCLKAGKELSTNSDGELTCKPMPEPDKEKK